MSEFPGDWEYKCIGEFASRVRRKNSRGECQDVMTISAVDGLVSQRDYFNKIVASKNTEGYTLLHRNDFAYNKSYSVGYPVGATRRLKTKERGIVSPLYICFELDEECLDPGFADYLFDSDWFVQAIFGIAKEGARSHGLLNIGIDEFFSALLPIPPLLEQKKIAEILSGIDRTIRAATSEKKYREKMRRSAVRQLTRGMSHQGTKTDSGTEFGMIPSHWDCQLIPDCCIIENAKRKPIKKEERAAMRGVYPYHGATRIQGYISEYSYEGEYVLIGEDGDHFSKYDEWEMAQYATGRFNVSNHAHAIRGTQICSEKWLYYSLLHRDITFHLTRQGATRFKLSKASLQCIPILLPPPKEQQRITNALDSMSDSISVLENRIVKLQALKSALSSDLLSGRKRVSV